MSSNKSPAFQFYVRDWISDPEITLMEWDARAMHLHLMCIAWIQDDACALPNNDQILMRWLSLNNEQDWLERLKPQIFSAWELEDGKWVQKRLKREKNKQLEHSEKRKEAANKRWNNRDKEQSKSNASAYPNGFQMECPSSSSSSSTSVSSNKAQKKFKAPEGISQNTADEFVEHRKNIRKPLTENAFNRAMSTALKASQELNITADQAIHEVIDAGWQGIKLEWLGNRLRSRNENSRANLQPKQESRYSEYDKAFEAEVAKEAGIGGFSQNEPEIREPLEIEDTGSEFGSRDYGMAGSPRKLQ